MITSADYSSDPAYHFQVTEPCDSLVQLCLIGIWVCRMVAFQEQGWRPLVYPIIIPGVSNPASGRPLSCKV